jgi:hypothetical protein
MVMYLTRHAAPCFPSPVFIELHWTDIKIREEILVRQASLAFFRTVCELWHSQHNSFLKYIFLSLKFNMEPSK